MHKEELIDAIAKETLETKATIRKVLDSQLEVITKELAKGKEKKVALIGFGTFETVKRPARTGRNPKTGAAIKIKASNTVKFKVGRVLKESINK